MTRQATEALRVDDIPVTRLDGVAVQELSRDHEDALEFSVIAVPDADGALPLPSGRGADVFVLDGDVALDDGTPIPAGSYAFVAGLGAGRSVRHTAGARYFVGTGAAGDGPGAADEVIDPETVAWQVRVQENAEYTRGGRSIGLVKFLRVDEHSKTTIGIGAMWPESGLDCAEHHEQLDEVLNLRGDMLLRDLDGSPVVADGLSYCWRPSRSVHLPKYSHRGNLTFFRNMKVLWSEHGAATFIPVEEWPEMVDEYRARLSVADATR